MECTRTSVFVITALVLTTGGFVLTVTAWYVAPINRFVDAVRLAGPVILFTGLVLLVLSCVICSYMRNNCCPCYRDRRKRVEGGVVEEVEMEMRREG